MSAEEYVSEEDVCNLDDLVTEINNAVNDTISKVENAQDVDDMEKATSDLKSKTSAWRTRLPSE